MQANFGDTASVCPVCLRVVPARRVGRDGGVYLEKACPDHGSFAELIWADGLDYAQWGQAQISAGGGSGSGGSVGSGGSGSGGSGECCGAQAQISAGGGSGSGGSGSGGSGECCGAQGQDGTAGVAAASAPCPTGCLDCDAHLTRPCCVLFELTTRCNLACPVCYAAAGGESPGGAGPGGKGPGGGETLAPDPDMGVIRAWYAALKARAGICHIQLSGGEPTLRDDLPEIIEAGIAQGFSYFQLNTNGIRLASDPALAVRLRKAGLSCVFLQFDGIDDAANVTLRGRELLATKGRAIDNCAACGLPVVLVPTVAAGVNDDQLAAIVSYGVARSPHVKGVHFQPLSRFGRCDTDAAGLTIPELLRLLEAQSGGMFQRGHFTGGSAESPYCSFNAAYLIADDGSLAPLRQRKATACCDAMLPEDGLERRALGGCSLEPLPKDGPVRRAQETQARRWGAASGSGECRRPEPGTLDEHLWKMGNRLFSITGMAFMDAHSMDFERLRSCYIFVMSNGGPVPFCAWNLSCASGKSAFRAMGG